MSDGDEQCDCGAVGDDDDRCYWDAACEDDVHCDHYDRGAGCCECGCLAAGGGR